MKKLLVAASLVLLTACSAPPPPQIDLMPQATLSSSDLVKGKSFVLNSKDLRAAQYVAIVDSGHSRVEPLHSKQNLRLVLDQVLSEQFKSQGFSLVDSSNNTVTLAIDQALVTVSHSVMSNEMSADVVIDVIAETPAGKLVRTFNGTAKRTGAFSASNEEIEQVLNDVINLVLQNVANDQELQKYMMERF